MAIDKSRVKYVAQLARLKLSDEEVASLAHDLTKILEHIETLNEVKTDKVPPTYRVVLNENVVREDHVVEKDDNLSLFENAPHKKGRFVKVPKIIDV